MADARIVEKTGMFSIYLHPCTSRVLADILDPSVPFVWIPRHLPVTEIQWWNTQLQLSKSGALHEVEVRLLECDLQFRTYDFLNFLKEFEGSGILLYQMTRRVPNTLTLMNTPDESDDRILLQNGLHLHFYLPHAHEVAQLRSPHYEVLELALQKPEIDKLALKSDP